ncbi:MAG: hypothetical protein ACYTF6_08700 [Planctomycetota bacterium]|jgi:hypothetical protein
MITVRCSCGKDLAFDDDFAGKSVKCSNCGGDVKIPAAAEGKGEPAAPPPAAPKPPPAAPPPAVPKPPAAAPPPAAPPGAQQPPPAYTYYPQPPFGAAAPGALRRAGRAGIIVLCVLVLLTLVVPWKVQDDTITWSWDVIGNEPDAELVFHVGLWVVAFVGLVLAIISRGLLLSALLALASIGGMVLMFIAYEETTLRLLAEPLERLSSRGLVLNLTVAFTAALFVFAEARGLVGRGVVLGVLQAVPAAACLVMTAILLIPNISEMVDTFGGVESMEDFALGEGLALAWLTLSMFFLFLGGLVGLIHGLAINSERRAPAMAAAALARLAVVVIMLRVMSVPAIEERWEEILPEVIRVILLYAMPIIFCAGLSRLIGDVVLAVKRPARSARAR